MNKAFRVIIALFAVLGLVLLGRDQVAWATPASDADTSDQARDISSAPLQDDDDEGSVKPPPKKIKVCKKGNYSVGGVATLKVKKLAKDYCIKASLRKRKNAPGQVPSGAGQILADITNLQFTYKNRPIDSLPENDGEIQICYAVPPGKQASLYFLKSPGGKRVWQPLNTSVKNGIACAPAHTSGFYALIGK